MTTPVIAGSWAGCMLSITKTTFRWRIEWGISTTRERIADIGKHLVKLESGVAYPVSISDEEIIR